MRFHESLFALLVTGLCLVMVALADGPAQRAIVFAGSALLVWVLFLLPDPADLDEVEPSRTTDPKESTP